MGKLFKIIIIGILLLACKKEEVNNDSVFDDYQSFIQQLTEYEDFEEDSEYFNTMLVLNETNQGNIRYDLIIHHPTTILRHVKVICIPNNFDASTQTAPCLGILDNEDVTLVSDRSDTENSIYKGINLSGISTTNIDYVNFMITFSIENKTITQYIKVTP